MVLLNQLEQIKEVEDKLRKKMQLLGKKGKGKRGGMHWGSKTKGRRINEEGELLFEGHWMFDRCLES